MEINKKQLDDIKGIIDSQSSTISKLGSLLDQLKETLPEHQKELLKSHNFNIEDTQKELNKALKDLGNIIPNA